MRTAPVATCEMDARIRCLQDRMLEKSEASLNTSPDANATEGLQASPRQRPYDTNALSSPTCRECMPCEPEHDRVLNTSRVRRYGDHGVNMLLFFGVWIVRERRTSTWQPAIRKPAWRPSRDRDPVDQPGEPRFDAKPWYGAYVSSPRGSETYGLAGQNRGWSGLTRDHPDWQHMDDRLRKQPRTHRSAADRSSAPCARRG